MGPRHAQVAQIQRARVLSAMFDVAAKRGAGNVSVTHVVELAGVSRRTFYELFEDCGDCLLAAFEDALLSVSRRVLPAYESGETWRERIRNGLVALLSFLDEEPAVARLLVVESLAGGSKALQRRNEVVARLAAAVEEGRAESAGAAIPPVLTGEGLVGCASSLIHARIINPEHTQRVHGEPLLGLTNQLMSMIVLPYLGGAAARRELDATVELSPTNAHEARLPADPFKGAGMRLTYRTVRVLLAVAEHPNASNRLIGETAGIKDQGQISKLLGRLQRLDLIANTGVGPGQGAPNAWTLTNTGQQMASTIRAHSHTQK